MSDRCSGQCCREFTLTGMGRTPDEIRERLRERGGPEGAQIADMVIPIRALVPGALAPNGAVVEVEPAGGGWVFTCSNHDPETGNCRAYETRPKYMCGAFPYGKPCEHGEKCTWTLGRLGLWPLAFVHYEWSSAEGTIVRRNHLPVIQPGGAPNQRAALSAAESHTVRVAAA